MSATGTSFRLAQVLGLAGTAWLSGNIASLSLITMPTLLNSSPTSTSTPANTPASKVPSAALTRQWRHTYELGKTQNRPISSLIGASFLYLAYRSRAGPRHVTYLYGLAALCTVGIAPFTLLAMAQTNEQLIERSEGRGGSGEGKKGVDEDEDEEVKRLLESWTRRNAVRSLLPLVGGAAAVIAALV